MIDTIIFDIGNVLADFRWLQYLKDCAYDEETIEKISSATVLSSRWSELDRGLQDEEELMRQCCEAQPSVADKIMRMFHSMNEVVKEYDYSADLVKRLKANGYKVYLLSNFARFSFVEVVKHYEFLKYVDGSVISYEVKYIKPEPEIFEALIDKYGINPRTAVFLDDLADNLKGAEPFGFYTIQVKNIDQMLEDLRKLGVWI